MFCPSCGVQLVSDTTPFCTHCGSPIKASGEAPSPAAGVVPAPVLATASPAGEPPHVPAASSDKRLLGALVALSLGVVAIGILSVYLCLQVSWRPPLNTSHDNRPSTDSAHASAPSQTTKSPSNPVTLDEQDHEREVMAKLEHASIEATIHPYDLLQNPFEYKNKVVLLNVRGYPILMDGSYWRFQEDFYYKYDPTGFSLFLGLRFDKMIGESEASYDIMAREVSGHFSSVRPVGQLIAVAQTPPDIKRPWIVEVIGPLSGKNVVGATVTAPAVLFIRYDQLPVSDGSEAPVNATRPSDAPRPSDITAAQSSDAAATRTPFDAKCLSYAPALVTLAGTITSKTFPGRPNYQSIEKGDQPETFWILNVGEPICTNDGAHPSLNPAEKDVSNLQLLFRNTQLYQTYLPLLNTKVKVTGSLFSATTIHHKTEVMLQVDSMEPAP
jgi:hypothetical protein